MSVHWNPPPNQFPCTDRDEGLTDVVTDHVAESQWAQCIWLLFLSRVSSTGYPTTEFSCSTFLNKTLRKPASVLHCFCLGFSFKESPSVICVGFCYCFFLDQLQEIFLIVECVSNLMWLTIKWIEDKAVIQIGKREGKNRYTECWLPEILWNLEMLYVPLCP